MAPCDVTSIIRQALFGAEEVDGQVVLPPHGLPRRPGRGVIENEHSAHGERSPPPQGVCISIHPEGKSCAHRSDLGRVRVLNDPAAR